MGGWVKSGWRSCQLLLKLAIYLGLLQTQHFYDTRSSPSGVNNVPESLLYECLYPVRNCVDKPLYHLSMLGPP
ncbi:hypothetical protein BKA67DRAFT_545561 [Truncatella angustata]|uniref:Secreted protein n=1 Tax=Truncatella angustata TaxID=152316 RepID=A0A9P9A335_9PEZI|nr:uncharacterized protein BKA67DRAFT_545561 [Truncatella angustata]KAH6659733.1 hypothetical protein BKA67DRAFT_545561 [Truncatella angustata]